MTNCYVTPMQVAACGQVMQLATPIRMWRLYRTEHREHGDGRGATGCRSCPAHARQIRARRAAVARWPSWRPRSPASTKTFLAQRLRQHARQNGSQLSDLHIRYQAQFAYIEGELGSRDRGYPSSGSATADQPRSGDSASTSPSTADTKTRIPPTGMTADTPKKALDCACGPYPGPLTLNPRKDLRGRPLK
jgi:hypothetical protein